MQSRSLKSPAGRWTSPPRLLAWPPPPKRAPAKPDPRRLEASKMPRLLGSLRASPLPRQCLEASSRSKTGACAMLAQGRPEPASASAGTPRRKRFRLKPAVGDDGLDLHPFKVQVRQASKLVSSQRSLPVPVPGSGAPGKAEDVQMIFLHVPFHTAPSLFAAVERHMTEYHAILASRGLRSNGSWRRWLVSCAKCNGKWRMAEATSPS